LKNHVDGDIKIIQLTGWS